METPTQDHAIGNGLVFRGRVGTSDCNSAISCAFQDEYGLRNYDLAGKIMFDIGSHVGGVAILAAQLGARVVAVEPVPENAELVRINAELNGFDIAVVEAAAGAPGGMSMSYGWYAVEGSGKDEPTADVHRFIGNTGIGQEDGYEPATVIDVPTVTLTDLVRDHGLPYLIKMDCEGGEWHLLSEPIIAEVEVITGEYHPWVDDALFDQESYFTDNVGEVRKRLEATHDLTFHGPDGMDAGHFLAIRRG